MQHTRMEEEEEASGYHDALCLDPRSIATRRALVTVSYIICKCSLPPLPNTQPQLDTTSAIVDEPSSSANRAKSSHCEQVGGVNMFTSTNKPSIGGVNSPETYQWRRRVMMMMVMMVMVVMVVVMMMMVMRMVLFFQNNEHDKRSLCAHGHDHCL